MNRAALRVIIVIAVFTGNYFCVTEYTEMLYQCYLNSAMSFFGLRNFDEIKIRFQCFRIIIKYILLKEENKHNVLLIKRFSIKYSKTFIYSIFIYTNLN